MYCVFGTEIFLLCIISEIMKLLLSSSLSNNSSTIKIPGHKPCGMDLFLCDDDLSELERIDKLCAAAQHSKKLLLKNKIITFILIIL